MEKNNRIHIEEAIREKAELMFSEKHKTMGDALGIQYTQISRDEMVALMPVDENSIQPFGILHGGASVALAETLSAKKKTRDKAPPDPPRASIQ